MHRTLERVVRVMPKASSEDEPTFEAHADAVVSSLLEALRGWLGLDAPLQAPNSDSPTKWAVDSRRATTDLWRSNPIGGAVLLTLEMVDERSESAAEMSLILGGNSSTGLWLREIHAVEEPDVRPNPPPFMQVLQEFMCIDRDENRTGIPFVSAADDASKARLIRKLGAPRTERSLPVMLLSRRTGETLIDAKVLAARLCGIARVVVLAKGFYWTVADFAHIVYGGSVRLYVPGYRAEDSGYVHPFMPASKIAETGIDAVLAWAMEETSQQTRSLTWSAPGIEVAIEARDREKWQTRVSAAMQEGVQITAEEYDQILDEAIDRADRFEAERDELREEVKQLESEVRRLRYDLASAFSGNELADSEPAFPSWPQLLLSASASEVYLSLDKGIMQEVAEKIFSKVMDPVYLASNGEVLDSTEGKCMVCPRKRSAGGMRVILQCVANDVRILELFTRHSDYEDFRDKLNQKPIDVGTYSAAAFMQWSTEIEPESESGHDSGAQ